MLYDLHRLRSLDIVESGLMIGMLSRTDTDGLEIMVVEIEGRIHRLSTEGDTAALRHGLEMPVRDELRVADRLRIPALLELHQLMKIEPQPADGRLFEALEKCVIFPFGKKGFHAGTELRR